MKLSRFIISHIDEIVGEWETFARSLSKPDLAMPTADLQDHARQMLKAIAADMEKSESKQQKKVKSVSDVSSITGGESAASTHGSLRQISGFTMPQVTAEFRAMRASVLRLWMETSSRASKENTQEILRFNEAIDQALQESAIRFSDQSNRTRDTFLAILGHDLRSPLATMTMAGSFLVRPTIDQANTIQIGARISRSAATMTTMVNDLLEYARIPSKILSAELDRKFMWLVVATALLLGGSLLLAWRVGGTIGHAVSGLVEPALALGSGKVVEPKSFNLREANEVGMALARASKMLLLAQYHASHDMLTGLANRGLFQDIIDQELALCQRNGACLSVLYIDLNDFKKINDEHGHATGDKLLLAVAERFRVTLRKSDLAARLGGDEFAVVLVNTPEEEAQHVAAKLVDCLASIYYIDELVINTSASIGVAGFPDSGITSKAILHSADIAMYRAKTKRKENSIYVPS